MEYPNESSERDQQQNDCNDFNQSMETSDSRDVPTQIASSSDRSTEPSISNSRDGDQISLPRYSRDSLSVGTRSLSSSIGNGEPSGSSARPISSVHRFVDSAIFGISNFSDRSLPNLNDLSSAQSNENWSTQNPDISSDETSSEDSDSERSESSLYGYLVDQPSSTPGTGNLSTQNTDDCIAGDETSSESSESSASELLADIPSQLQDRGINSSVSTTAAVIPPSNNTFVDVIAGTSHSSNQRSLALLQIPDSSESRRQSESGTPILNPNNSDQSSTRDSFPNWSQDVRNAEHRESQSEHQPIDNSNNNIPDELQLNLDHGPLPRHWQTGVVELSIPFIPQLHPSFKPSKYYWRRRRHFECRKAALSASSTSPVDRYIFSPLKEIIQETSLAASGNLDQTLATPAIDRLELSTYHIMDLSQLSDTLEGMEMLYEEETFRMDLIQHSSFLRDLLREIQETFTEIYQRLPTTPSSYREPAEPLLSRALIRVSVQRQYIRDVARHFRRCSRRNPGSQEDSYRDLRRLVLFMIQDITFLLDLTAPARE